MPLPLIFTLVVALAAAPLQAHQDPPQYNRVNLNESAQTEVDNDLLVAVLFAQAEGRDATAPADQVNRTMDWAVNLAKSHPGVKVQTLAYRSNAIYNKGNLRGWRINQSLRLESRDSRELGDLSENSEYTAALEKRDQLASRATRMENELGMAKVINHEMAGSDFVNVTARFTQLFRSSEASHFSHR